MPYHILFAPETTPTQQISRADLEEDEPALEGEHVLGGGAAAGFQRPRQPFRKRMRVCHPLLPYPLVQLAGDLYVCISGKMSEKVSMDVYARMRHGKTGMRLWLRSAAHQLCTTLETRMLI